MAGQTIDEELEVLSSIYDNTIQTFSTGDKCTIQLLYSPNDDRSFTIDITFSSFLYPVDHSSIEIALKSSTYYVDSSFSHAIVKRISSENPGGNILFQLLEEIKDYLSSIQHDKGILLTDFGEIQGEGEEEVEYDPSVIHQRIMDREKKAKNNQRVLPSDKVVRIIHGPNVIEQKSTFQAHIAEVTSMEEVEFVRYTLLLDKRVAAATHNIMTYRFTDPTTGLVHHDCDDDGECAAGGRLAEMVRLMGATNVIVVVSRWFGGVLMGPSRFKFICNTARDLMEEHGFCAEEKRSKNRK